MCTHNICFEQKYENSQNISSENCHFYSGENSLYVAWACFNNVYGSSDLFISRDVGCSLIFSYLLKECYKSNSIYIWTCLNGP